jgi:hypothetical protein
VIMEIKDFSRITACGECCDGCERKKDSTCEGCIETDGHCWAWKESGQCLIHKCAREHNVQFCGLCDEFPCVDLTTKIHWNPNVIEHLSKLKEAYELRAFAKTK